MLTLSLPNPINFVLALGRKELKLSKRAFMLVSRAMVDMVVDEEGYLAGKLTGHGYDFVTHTCTHAYLCHLSTQVCVPMSFTNGLQELLIYRFIKKRTYISECNDPLAGFKLITSSNVTELLTFSVVYCHLHLIFYTSHDL